MYSAPTKRSNRPVTQFVCDHLEKFLLGKEKPGTYFLHNTYAKCIEDKHSTTFTASLRESDILTVTLSLPDEQPVLVNVSVSDYFAFDGRPTKTVVERLNGLLDTLGIHGAIPEGVRIFKDRDEGIFYLGKGENKIAVGRKYARNIRLSPDPEEFSIQSSDLGMNLNSQIVPEDLNKKRNSLGTLKRLDKGQIFDGSAT